MYMYISLYIYICISTHALLTVRRIVLTRTKRNLEANTHTHTLRYAFRYKNTAASENAWNALFFLSYPHFFFVSHIFTYTLSPCSSSRLLSLNPSHSSPVLKGRERFEMVHSLIALKYIAQGNTS